MKFKTFKLKIYILLTFIPLKSVKLRDSMTDYSFSNLAELFKSFRILNKNKTKKIYPTLVSVLLLYDNKQIYYVKRTTFGINPLIVLRCDGTNLSMTIENIEKRDSTEWEKWTFNKEGLSLRRTRDKVLKAVNKAEQVPVLKYMFVFPIAADASERWGVWTWKNGSLICEKKSSFN